MINLEYAKNEKFKNHVATFEDYGKIKVLDFRNKDGHSDYHVRFLFDEEYFTLHITGDLGELTASNYNNMTYEKFYEFVNSLGYFETKVDCHRSAFYEYDDIKAKDDLKKLFEDYEITIENFKEISWHDDLEDIIEEILDDFNQVVGIIPNSDGWRMLDKVICDAWEDIPYIGKQPTRILNLYMLAFELAQKQLEENSNVEKA